MSRRQCPAVFGRGLTTVFCIRCDGHEGDHRGLRVQWNQQGEKVPFTLNSDGVEIILRRRVDE